MKIIDLLNKIANGEEVPRQVDYYDITYTYNGDCYVSNEGELLLDHIEELTRCLNEEIEIIEEDKKIEKIEMDYLYKNFEGNKINIYERLDKNFVEIERVLEIVTNTINELIDEVNKLKGDKNEK